MRGASLALAACAALAAAAPACAVGAQPAPAVSGPASAGLASTVPRSADVQFAPSVSLASEYSARGVSLSQGRPAAQATLEVDSAGGWYGGAFASRVSLPDSAASVQLIAWGGYARRLPSGLAWEAGALAASFPGGQQYRYHEFYAGLSRDRVTARVYFSPAYYGSGKTVYAEVNAAWPLRERFTLTGHAGLLHPFGAGDGDGDGQARNRLDLRGGLNVELDGCTVQLALVAGAPGRHRRQAARALAVSATYAF